MAVDHGYERNVFALQSLAQHEPLPPEAKKGQCERCREGEGEKAPTEFAARLGSGGAPQPTFQGRRWRGQRKRCCQRSRNGLRSCNPLGAFRAQRNVALDVARRVVVEDPKRIEIPVFAQMFDHERVPSALARSVCNLRMAIEMRLLIVPSGTFSSCEIWTWVLFP